jgi:hypothetical protein
VTKCWAVLSFSKKEQVGKGQVPIWILDKGLWVLTKLKELFLPIAMVLRIQTAGLKTYPEPAVLP